MQPELAISSIGAPHEIHANRVVANMMRHFAKRHIALLNIHDLKAAYEKAIGHPTSNSTIYNLLARHDWRKLMPRPFHPDRDLEAQKDFKKKGSS
jgi:hypothetical protein